jgi:DNA (cytosine-5)-methyltransferase 1
MSPIPRAAEFFAGIGLMRAGLEAAGIEVIWANDIEPRKREMYAANFGASEYRLGDVCDVRGDEVPEAELATASFPCTDLSLAGNRVGLGRAASSHARADGSSMFWEFARILKEMGARRPRVVLLENVLGFASSHGGTDLLEAVRSLNRLGYSCDLFTLDARHFVPQSRPRLFIVGLESPAPRDHFDRSRERPAWLARLIAAAPDLRLHQRALPPLPTGPPTLDHIVEAPSSPEIEWWAGERAQSFVNSLSEINARRLAQLAARPHVAHHTAYRRTRAGRAVWEIREDTIAGCLRTARGGSSKQALVEAGRGRVRIRWMTPREYARLMGAPDFALGTRTSSSLFGFGDAVCVPVVSWLCEHYVAVEARAARLALAS